MSSREKRKESCSQAIYYKYGTMHYLLNVLTASQSH
jgi:hypothetical protein